LTALIVVKLKFISRFKPTKAIIESPTILRVFSPKKVSKAHKVVIGYGDEDFVELLEKALGLGDVAVGQTHVDYHKGHTEVGEKQLKVPVFL